MRSVASPSQGGSDESPGFIVDIFTGEGWLLEVLRIWPETTETSAPNSPIARALQSRIHRRGSAHFFLATVRQLPPPLSGTLWILSLAPSVSAASSFFADPWLCMSGITSRATNGKVTKMVARTMPGNREDDVNPVRLATHGPTDAWRRRHTQNENETGATGRHRKRQVDQRRQDVLPRENRILRYTTRRRSQMWRSAAQQSKQP